MDWGIATANGSPPRAVDPMLKKTVNWDTYTLFRAIKTNNNGQFLLGTYFIPHTKLSALKVSFI